MSRKSKGHQLRLLGDVWYICWSDYDVAAKRSRSQRRTTGTGDRSEAEAILANFILEKRAVDSLSSSDSPVSFFLVDYWENHAGSVESSERQRSILQHLKAHFGLVPPDAIDIPMVQDYVAARRRGAIGTCPAGDGTVRLELTYLVAALNFAVKHKKLDRAKVPHIPMPPAPAAKDRWLERGEAESLREACADFRLRLFVEMGLHTAARKRAILNLRKSQVDLERMQIDFNPPGRIQTKKRRPKVPIATALLPWIQKAYAVWPDSELVMGASGDIGTTFDTACRKAGLEPDRPWVLEKRKPSRVELDAYRRARVTPHTLRHTWATWAAQSKVSLWEIAGVLGDTLATVETKYAHHHPDYLRDAINFNNEREKQS